MHSLLLNLESLGGSKLGLRATYLTEFISWITSGQQVRLRLDLFWFAYYRLILYPLMLALKAIQSQVFELMANFTLNFLTLSFIWLSIITFCAPWARPVGGFFVEIPITFGELKVGSMQFMLVYLIIGIRLFNNQVLLQRLQTKSLWLTAIIWRRFLLISLMA